MNSGRYLGTITANQHGKAVIDQLGWRNVETFGHWYHGYFYALTSFPLTSFFISKINDQRKAAFIRENELKAAAAAASS
jgi:hypothetical protein